MKFILKTHLFASCIVVGSLFVACKGEESGENLDEATLALSLEVNEDGSDTSATDPLEEEPFLLAGCGFDLVERHLRRTFDENDDGKLDEGERTALHEEFGGELEPRPLFARPPTSGEGGGPPDAPAGFGLRGRMRHHRMELLARIYDADDSGRLDEKERAVLATDLEVRCENRRALLVEEFDADADGELDRTEWKVAHEAIRARFLAKRAAFIAEFDADGDGTLDDEERASAGEALRGELEAKRESDLEHFDLDDDGKLSEEERLALVLELRARVRGEYFGNEDDSAVD